MKQILLAVAMVGMLIGPGHALDFTVTEVIEIGPIYGGGMLKPAQWSPDGVKLAYFRDDALFWADSAGKSHEVAKIDIAPHRFAWASNDEIILFQWDWKGPRTTLSRMSMIDLVTGEIKIIEEYDKKLMKPSPEGEIKGPYQTVEGDAYYHLNTDYANSVFLAPKKYGVKRSASESHFLRTGEDALYLVSVDQTDSVKISNKPYEGYMGILPLVINRDKTHIMFGGNIIRLADDHLIILDTLQLEVPEGTEACGFGDPSFNPLFPEVTFSRGCDDGHSYAVRWVGVYDFNTHEYTRLDPLVGLESCVRPVYAPDGLRIAFLSEGILYVIEREVKL